MTTFIKEFNDPLIEPYRAIKDKHLMREYGLFVAEGEHLVKRLLDSRFKVHSILMTEHRYENKDWDIPENIPLYISDSSLISAIVGFPFHRGVLAMGVRQKLPQPKMLFVEEKPNQLLVLPEINDSENLGTIMRTAAGLGFQHLIFGENCSDPFSRRAVRTSMGAVFQLQLAQSDDLKYDLSRLKKRFNFKWHATVIDKKAQELHTIHIPEKVGLLFGTEANGLDDKWLALCDERVTIPMEFETDSLNVGVAAGIFLYTYQYKNKGL